jgi:hypothetical protein
MHAVFGILVAKYEAYGILGEVVGHLIQPYPTKDTVILVRVPEQAHIRHPFTHRY